MSALQPIVAEVSMHDAALPYVAAPNVVPLSPNKTDIDTHTVWITRFEDETAQAMSKGEWSLPAWRDHILAENAKSKTATPWLKLATFGNVRTDKNCLRHDANVLEISGVECDYDDEVISFDEAVEVMCNAGVRCLLYTSASHSPEKPRWRILAPLSKNHKPTSRAPMVGRLNGLFAGKLAPESFVLSTSYHYGSVNSNPHHRVAVLDGQFLNLMDRLHAGSIDKDGHRVGHKDFEQKSSAGKPREPGNEFSDYNPYPAEKGLIVAALAVIDADCGHKPWYKIGCAIRFELGDEGNAVFHDWSKTAKAIYKYAECEKKWRETEGNTYHRAGSIFYLATLTSPHWRDEYEASKQAASDDDADDDNDGGDSGEGEEYRAPAFSEESLALIFAKRHEPNLRYVAKWGSWMQWDGTRWGFDETMRAFSLSRAICREAASACNNPKGAMAIASAKTVAAIERLAKADRVLAATVEQWDAVPRKFNDTESTIDLRTGCPRTPNRTDYITQKGGCQAAPVGTPHPIWSAFLNRITANDRELIAFLQRYIGYCLTGETVEHVFVFAYGSGANGKGVFLNTIVKVFGDYATVADMATFIDSKNDRHPTDIAKLRGARLVVAQETQQGRSWDEAKIKAITGGDRQTARFMRQDFFDFYPTFKLFIAGNHKPRLQNVDEAMRRRLLLVPFTVQIPPTERDTKLAEKLEAEWPAILRWAIDGCLEWQRTGLAPPAVVTDATDEYFAGEDSFGQWLEDRCDADPGNNHKWDKVADLFTDWSVYAEAEGDRRVSKKAFNSLMSSRGFTACRKGTPTGRCFSGVRLKLDSGGGQ
jgi:putative DNA primase/helicase